MYVLCQEKFEVEEGLCEWFGEFNIYMLLYLKRTRKDTAVIRGTTNRNINPPPHTGIVDLDLITYAIVIG